MNLKMLFAKTSCFISGLNVLTLKVPQDLRDLSFKKMSYDEQNII